MVQMGAERLGPWRSGPQGPHRRLAEPWRRFGPQYPDRRLLNQVWEIMGPKAWSLRKQYKIFICQYQTLGKSQNIATWNLGKLTNCAQSQTTIFLHVLIVCAPSESLWLLLCTYIDYKICDPFIF